MVVNEENFIEEIKKKNEEGLEYVIDKYGWILKSVLKKHLFYIEDHYEECMNDCLLAVWKNIDSFNPEKSTFKNWLGGIAKYKSIDCLRKYFKDINNKNIEEVSLIDERTPLKEIIENEISIETEKMLSNLSKEDRDIFKKLYVEEKDMNQVSKETGLKKELIYNRLSRGKKKIRRSLK
ncbi:MAG: sigma-70 family RNA polymerase sigma factor [Peptoniphilaceae bacterium]